MVVTSNDEARRRRCGCCATGARRSGITTCCKGFNYRMEGLQGAILRVKLRHLDAWTEARRARAPRVRRAARRLATSRRPIEMPYARHVYHVYAVRTDDRDALQQHAAGRRRADRHPLSDPGAPAAGVRRPRLQGRATSRCPRRPRANDAEIPGQRFAMVCNNFEDLVAIHFVLRGSGSGFSAGFLAPVVSKGRAPWLADLSGHNVRVRKNLHGDHIYLPSLSNITPIMHANYQ